MKMDNIRLELRGPSTGLSLMDGNRYIATYRSVNDCMLDLAYHFCVDNLANIVKAFMDKMDRGVIAPMEYRGVCTEYFLPTEAILSYVYYKNTLTELFDCFSFHEERALKHEEYFMYGVQGTHIDRFNQKTGKYEFWTGGDLKSVTDVMNQLKSSGQIIPQKLKEEYEDLDLIDVFISHKSQDYSYAKAAYDELTGMGRKVFLSEISLPAMADTDYTASIDYALDKTKGMVLIAKSIDTFNSGWVNYEWSSFLNEKRSGRKSGNLITIVSDEQSILKLPYALRQYETITFDHISKLSNYF